MSTTNLATSLVCRHNIWAMVKEKKLISAQKRLLKRLVKINKQANK